MGARSLYLLAYSKRFWLFASIQCDSSRRTSVYPPFMRLFCRQQLKFSIVCSAGNQITGHGPIVVLCRWSHMVMMPSNELIQRVYKKAHAIHFVVIGLRVPPQQQQHPSALHVPYWFILFNGDRSLDRICHNGDRIRYHIRWR